MLSLFSADSRNCGPGERAKQGQFGLRPFCISIQLASLDLGLVQYQYELKLFKWTIQSIDYKWRKYRLETYKFLLCTVLATVLYHMALKLPWGGKFFLFARKSWCPVAQSHQRKINFGTFFYLNIAEIDSITTHLQQF